MLLHYMGVFEIVPPFTDAIGHLLFAMLLIVSVWAVPVKRQFYGSIFLLDNILMESSLRVLALKKFRSESPHCKPVSNFTVSC